MTIPLGTVSAMTKGWDGGQFDDNAMKPVDTYTSLF